MGEEGVFHSHIEKSFPNLEVSQNESNLKYLYTSILCGVL
jgi:hypothetical protein